MNSLKESALRFGMQYFEALDHFRFIREGHCPFSYEFVKKHRLIPLEEQDDGELWIAIANPLNLQAIEDARCMSGRPTRACIADEAIILQAIEKCFGQTKESASSLLDTIHTDLQKEQIKEAGDGYDLLAQGGDAPVVRLLNSLIVEAIQQRASDIHFEPGDGGLEVRYRIDGVLQKRHAPFRDLQTQLLSRIKVLARLDIAEQRRPQDGRIRLNVGQREIDFRVSTLPTVSGERIVLRILDRSHLLVGLDSLGIRDEVLEKFRSLIRCTEGIILVTGPTGSGKTTTLYSALTDIHTSEINIMTVEEPAEYKLSGMSQTSINPNTQISFAVALRHLLRQDPDVIMVGEIRDFETAETAIQASLTGHLVFSTLHTNDAPSAVTRLTDMGIEPYLLSSSLIAIMAQRLVRKLCIHCKAAYTPSPSEEEAIGVKSETLYRAVGCSHCFDTGYHGRHGIYELIPVGHSLKQEILKNRDSNALKKIARNMGYSSLKDEAARLVASGITSGAEMLRVCRSLDEG
jgi:general secretion pathway protein E